MRKPCAAIDKLCASILDSVVVPVVAALQGGLGSVAEQVVAAVPAEAALVRELGVVGVVLVGGLGGETVPAVASVPAVAE